MGNCDCEKEVVVPTEVIAKLKTQYQTLIAEKETLEGLLSLYKQIEYLQQRGLKLEYGYYSEFSMRYDQKLEILIHDSAGNVNKQEGERRLEYVIKLLSEITPKMWEVIQTLSNPIEKKKE